MTGDGCYVCGCITRMMMKCDRMNSLGATTRGKTFMHETYVYEKRCIYEGGMDDEVRQGRRASKEG